MNSRILAIDDESHRTVRRCIANALAQSMIGTHDAFLHPFDDLLLWQLCAQAFQWSTQHPVTSAVVSDEASVSACRQFLHDHRLLVEPACGASLSLLYDGSPALDAFTTLLVIVYGGAAATVDQLQT
jgi:L-serine/L-threonine ammonia-lyase